MEGIEKLPKWAQAEVRRLEGERDAAVRQLNQWEDEQTEAPFRFEDHVCDGDQGSGPTRRTKYVQAHRMSITYGGVDVDIVLRDEGIDIKYEAVRGGFMRRIALVPKSHQHILLESPEGDT